MNNFVFVIDKNMIPKLGSKTLLGRYTNWLYSQSLDWSSAMNHKVIIKYPFSENEPSFQQIQISMIQFEMLLEDIFFLKEHGVIVEIQSFDSNKN